MRNIAVDDVVGMAGEAVEGVDGSALVRRQQQRCEVVGAAMRSVEPAALLIPGSDGGVGHRNPGPTTRSAASRPDISAVGTPTPGWVPQPASTTLSSGMLPVRNGPVCANRWVAENGVPAARP